MPDSTPVRVPVEERLFSLVLALLATENGLTKNEILSSVQGYRQRYSTGGDNATLERQFERDKDDIRDLGVPLETVEAPDDRGGNHHLRYRIPKGAYDLPRDVTFSPEETTLLALASAVWRRGSLSDGSRRALMKLRSIGAESSEPIIGFAPSLSIRESAFEPLSLALDRSVCVVFLYLKPGEAAAAPRTVEPLALVQHRGRWHLYGFDRGAEGRRTFLLSRVVGAVEVTKQPFTAPDDDPAATVLAELDELWHRQCAVVEVAEGTDAAARLAHEGPPDAGGRLPLHYTDAHVLADELAGFGPEVTVISPAELRTAVRERLERVLADHEGAVGAADAGETR